VLHYQEEGFIHPVAQSPGPPAVFDVPPHRLPDERGRTQAGSRPPA
jgi:hypothetical protein